MKFTVADAGVEPSALMKMNPSYIRRHPRSAEKRSELAPVFLLRSFFGALRSRQGGDWLAIGIDLKHNLQLRPHSADAAVGEIAIQELPRRRDLQVPIGYLRELWMVQGIEGLPSTLNA